MCVAEGANRAQFVRTLSSTFERMTNKVLSGRATALIAVLSKNAMLHLSTPLQPERTVSLKLEDGFHFLPPTEKTDGGEQLPDARGPPPRPLSLQDPENRSEFSTSGDPFGGQAAVLGSKVRKNSEEAWRRERA
ncbi:hypothetical protein QR680_005144 [Steinernema hermaphroditum]|uniref:Uncharacterized protein n=1 Tax=Steinernema hermaphroditum TaxID=289476 RepID=A0AA39HR04_9BILA|nr:hypothetical protein QR680_005144 [Steinernema hermaphroditum]